MTQKTMAVNIKDALEKEGYIINVDGVIKCPARKRVTRAQAWKMISEKTPGFLECVRNATQDPNLSSAQLADSFVLMYNETSARIHAHVDGLSQIDVSVFGLDKLKRAALECAMESLPVKLARGK